ncbi:hypothetical protein ACFFVB_18485 [Formosa undariae]|uniref:Uncharacterized protein n=1 Tax=Formosa undariae TaxID=1325436 RepID=A0ABV5F6J4_9FLAO
MVTYEVIKKMRYFSNNGIPFSMEFIGLNQAEKNSKGLVVVNKALLRVARQTSSTTLLSYTNLETDEPKHVHLPLIIKFNGELINHGN